MNPAAFYELAGQFPAEQLRIEDTLAAGADDAPFRFGVWCRLNERDGDDLIGAADTIEDAVAEARETLRGWAVSS